ncbi:hypothetical protein DFJ77DRAFT_462840 [Powellomyces hirtus]|nr:hypothetical protein DFJ77DRAFT_462840 [Powellomyces hirtus]
MPRYQPLSLDPSDSPRPRSKTAFYCGWCGDAIIQLFDTISHRFYSRTEFVGYFAGMLFALGWWVFIDGATYASTRPEPGLPVQVAFVDWVPGILSTVALIVVNLIDREMLNAEGDGYGGGSNVATKARGCAFVGVSMALGALGGGFAVTILKYIIHGYSQGDEAYFGFCIAGQNALIFASSMILWFGRNGGSTEAPFPGY